MKCIAGLENFEEHVLDAKMKDATIVRSCSSFEIVVTLMQVSAAFPGGRPPGNSRATPGLGTEFVLKSRPGDRGFSLHLYFEN